MNVAREDRYRGRGVAPLSGCDALVLATSTTSGAVVKYSDAADGTYSPTAPTLGEGTTTVYAKAFSSTGSCSSAAVSNTYKVDTIAPAITDDGTTQTPNGAGWYKSDVTNQFTASDATSGLPASFTNPFTKSSTGEGSAVKINSGPVTDNAGNTNPGIDSAAFKIDKSGPTITDLGPTTNANGAGWYNTDVTNHFKASDSLSGLNAACVANFPAVGSDNIQSKTTSGEGTNLKVTSDSCTDVAGNSATGIDSATFQIDKTKPSLNPSVSPNPVVLNGTATATANATDTLSTIATQSCDPVITSSVGAKSVNCSATDKAGNTQTASASYSVGFNFVGFTTPVDNDNYMNVLKAGQAIPLKWRLLDANNNPVTNLQSATITVKSLSCATGSSDLLEEVAAGGSGLQNLGDGYYQYNWKSPSNYANSCRTLQLDLGESTPRTAKFKFNK